MSLLYDLRLMRVAPTIIDEKIVRIVQGLKERRFLEGTVFEKMALEAKLDPYSLLSGIIIGIAITLVLGFFTVKFWLPRVIARITGKTIAETARVVREILG